MTTIKTTGHKINLFLGHGTQAVVRRFLGVSYSIQGNPMRVFESLSPTGRPRSIRITKRSFENSLKHIWSSHTWKHPPTLHLHQMSRAVQCGLHVAVADQCCSFTELAPRLHEPSLRQSTCTAVTTDRRQCPTPVKTGDPHTSQGQTRLPFYRGSSLK
jgi:hypothetical protein